VGLSGLERKYQRELVGTPTTEVVAMNSAGQQTAVLAQWTGSAGIPVRTTIDSSVQDAALTALDGMPNSGEIVAVRASTGEVLAVAQHQASGLLPADGALNAKLARHRVHHRNRGLWPGRMCRFYLCPVRVLQRRGETFTSGGPVS
jgi:hypothetical protein